jgi:hypothetical protein
MYRRTTSFSVLLISFTGSDGSSVALSSVRDGGGVRVCVWGGDAGERRNRLYMWNGGDVKID